MPLALDVEERLDGSGRKRDAEHANAAKLERPYGTIAAHDAHTPSAPRSDHRTVPNHPARETKPLADPPLRVLLVEDSALLVQRIAELVREVPGVNIVATAGSETEAIALLALGEIDAVILDLQLHTGSGFGILREIRRQDAKPRVIVFTNFAIAAYRDTALALGATYFLDKSRDYDRLPSVLQALSDTRH